MRKLWDQDYKSVYLNYLYKSDSKEEKDAQVIKLVSKLWALLEAQGEFMIKRSWVFIPGAGLQHSCRAHCLGAKTRKIMGLIPAGCWAFFFFLLFLLTFVIIIRVSLISSNLLSQFTQQVFFGGTLLLIFIQKRMWWNKLNLPRSAKKMLVSRIIVYCVAPILLLIALTPPLTKNLLPFQIE